MDSCLTKSKCHAVDIFFAVLWIAALLTGIALKSSMRLTGWPPKSNAELVENRNLTQKPSFRKIPVKTWGQATEAWYNDHFPFRRAVIDFYKELHFEVFKSPVKRFVPGRGDWLFGRMGYDGGRGDVWPEVEDYMGIVKLNEKTINDWKTLFEGRAAWAEAHGIHYLEVIPPMKASVHPEKMLPMITMHKKESCREDLRDALAGSPAESNVLFLVESLQAEVAGGKEVFYEEDHHENAYGAFCIYRDIVARLRDLWYPELGTFPFYEDDIPEDVRSGKAPGCWETEDRRLAISNPELKVVANHRIRIEAKNPRFPHGPVCVAREKEGIKILVGHDSFLRYPFETWHTKEMDKFTIPVGSGISQVSMLIFTRFTTEKLNGLISKELPDVIIEQFSEGRLQFGTNGKNYAFLDETMVKAAEWGRGTAVDASGTGSAEKLMALAVMDNVQSVPPKSPVTVELRDKDGSLVASADTTPGLRRAVFFGDIPPASGIKTEIKGGTADNLRLEFRTK